MPRARTRTRRDRPRFVLLLFLSFFVIVVVNGNHCTVVVIGAAYFRIRSTGTATNALFAALVFLLMMMLLLLLLLLMMMMRWRNVVHDTATRPLSSTRPFTRVRRQQHPLTGVDLFNFVLRQFFHVDVGRIETEGRIFAMIDELLFTLLLHETTKNGQSDTSSIR